MNGSYLVSVDVAVGFVDGLRTNEDDGRLVDLPAPTASRCTPEFGCAALPGLDFDAALVESARFRVSAFALDVLFVDVP